MSDQTKDATPAPKLAFTKETVDRQIAQTAKELNYLQDKVQQAIGLLNYLRIVKDSFEFPDAPKPPLEVKQ